MAMSAECEAAFMGVTLRVLDANVAGGEALLADGCERLCAYAAELADAVVAPRVHGAAHRERHRVVAARPDRDLAHVLAVERVEQARVQHVLLPKRNTGLDCLSSEKLTPDTCVSVLGTRA